MNIRVPLCSVSLSEVLHVLQVKAELFETYIFERDIDGSLSLRCLITRRMICAIGDWKRIGTDTVRMGTSER